LVSGIDSPQVSPRATRMDAIAKRFIARG
jgi:hypothetical protein